MEQLTLLLRSISLSQNEAVRRVNVGVVVFDDAALLEALGQIELLGLVIASLDMQVDL